MGINVERYLDFLNISDVSGDRLALLKKIQRKHLECVPFENFDIHMFGELDLSVDKLYEKIVVKRRGGICYELNYLLYNLLVELRYDVSILAGQVLEEGTEYDHLLLIVAIGAGRYLVDVGFGDNFLEPLLFECDVVQRDLKGRFRLIKCNNVHYCLEHEVANKYRRAYRFTIKKRYIDEFVDRMNWFCESDESLFARRLFCSIERMDGRVSMNADKIVTTLYDTRTEQAVTDFEDFKRNLRDEFQLEFGKDEELLRGIYDRQKGK